MLSYVGYGALFVAFVAIVICAEVLRREHRATQLVADIKVEITAGEKSTLADSESIER